MGALHGYGQLLLVLVGCMHVVVLVTNPRIVFWKTRRNTCPLVFTCLRDSGLTSFFTRSSAANVPFNLAPCKRLKPHEDTCAISIHATINMAGAAISITVMTLAAAHTLGVAVDIPTAMLLCVVLSLAAAGVSGVAGGRWPIRSRP